MRDIICHLSYSVTMCPASGSGTTAVTFGIALVPAGTPQSHMRYPQPKGMFK
jgi:hypothetical protein